ncbi:MAG: porin [Longimicrobiales bacterium]
MGRNAQRVLVAVILLLAGSVVRAQSPAAVPPSATVKFETQFQFSTTSVDKEDGSRQPGSTFEFRRLRVYFDIKINDWITGAVESDMSMGRLTMRKAFMDLSLSKAFALKLGQDKKPFSLLETTSSSKYPAIETGVRIRGLAGALQHDNAAALTMFRGAPLIADEQNLVDQLLYKGYELGATAHGTVGRFSYDAGVYNGTGLDQLDDNDGKSVAGRLAYAVPMKKPLTLGVAASHRELNFPTAADTSTRSGTAYALEAEWGAFRTEGFWLLAEAATGSNIVTEDKFKGATAILTYFHPTKGRIEGVEPVFRIGAADPNDAREDDGAMTLTPGINVYFTGRNKFSLNYEVFNPSGPLFNTQKALRAQVQLYM